MMTPNIDSLRSKCAALVLITLSVAACSSDSGPGYIPEPTFLNNEGRVIITGSALIGETLTAQIIDPDGAVNPSFQWSTGDADIPDASMSAYTLTEAEVGRTLTVSVRYNDAAGFTEVLTSTPTPTVVSELNVEGTIAIVGVPTLGNTLTASISDANGLTITAPSYTWLANNIEIAGATGSTYVLQQAEVDTNITVAATYTDDAGFSESIVSLPFGPISANVVNVVGTVTINGQPIVGVPLTAIIQDPNGTSGPINYQWLSENMPIETATAATYTPTVSDLGSILGVAVSYIDDDGFEEGPIQATLSDIVYSAIVVGEESLLTAVATATVGDLIGLASPANGEDYMDMSEINFAADNLTIQRTADSSAVISGATCIVLSGNNILLDGLIFERLDWLGGGTCDENGDGSIYLSGAGSTIRNSEFRGEAFPRTVPSVDPYHYISLKGTNHIIERNLFEDKDMDNEGSAITMFADTIEMVNQGHIIQYNLFRNMPGRSGDAGSRDSTAHAIQAGRTTGSDAQGEGRFTIQYNRFDNIQSERRLIRVQSGANTIHGNTIVDSLGLIALEDGYANTVTQNVILSEGEDSDDGGISFAPLGHTITDNYINNLRTTSGQRAALLINADPLSGSGNRAIFETPGLDLTVTVARNSVVNARQAVAFEDADCGLVAHVLDFDDNLVFNQTSAMSINGNTNGSGRTAIIDGDFTTASCAIDAASNFDNNHIYAQTLSQSGTFDFNGRPGDNLVGGQDGAAFTVNDQGLLSADGASAGIGVDTSMLHVITESEVGPGSTWVA
ncbi:MAG: chondroitinase-B domain-containing protein, partial [Myxococcota bacterium]